MKRLFPPYCTPADIVTILFLLFLCTVETLFGARIPQWYLPVMQNLLIIAGLLWMARTVHAGTAPAPLRFVRDWYLIPMILFVYTQSSSLGQPLHGRDYDDLLIAADRALFGGDPTVWAYRFAHPVLTEVLQIAYSSYYFFFVALYIDFYRRSDRTAFSIGTMLIVYGFYLSYLGYLVLPAVGPRFTLHTFSATDLELPGVFLTPYLREIINAGGGAGADAVNPFITAHRDAFPSGHTQLTLTSIYLGFAMYSIHRWWLLVVGTLLIISTIYLRYHYGVDVLAGMLFFLFTIWSGKKLHHYLR